MGAKASIPDKRWAPLSTGEHFDILKNNSDNTEAEKYTYTLDNRFDPCAEAAIFNKRAKTTLPIVKTYSHSW
jgi:hypothetical protein